MWLRFSFENLPFIRFESHVSSLRFKLNIKSLCFFSSRWQFFNLCIKKSLRTKTYFQVPFRRWPPLAFLHFSIFWMPHKTKAKRTKMCGIYAHYLEKIPFVLEGKQYGGRQILPTQGRRLLHTAAPVPRGASHFCVCWFKKLTFSLPAPSLPTERRRLREWVWSIVPLAHLFVTN